MRRDGLRVNSVLTAALCVLIGYCAQVQAQTIYWARVIPGKPRLVVVHGESLRASNEHGCNDRPASGTDPIPAATLNGTALLHRYFDGAESHEWVRSGHRVAWFEVPTSVTSGSMSFIYTPYGKSALSTITLTVPAEAHQFGLYPSGTIQEIDTPIVVDDNETLDLGGDVVRPSASFSGAALVLVHDGATLKNGYIDCGKTGVCDAINLINTTPPPGTTNPPPTGITLANLDIRNEYDGGVYTYETKRYGIESTFGLTASTIIDVRICADRCAETGPTQTVNTNNWIRCEFTGPRGHFDGGLGRLVNGGSNLMLWCHWHDIDRGPTFNQWAGPLSKNLFWECRQERTGLTVGASEGTLFEIDSNEYSAPTLVSQITSGVNKGKSVVLINPSSTNGTDEVRNIKAGNYVYDPVTGDYELITSVIATGQASAKYLIYLDGTLDTAWNQQSNPTSKLIVGNILKDNTFVRCRFQDGAKGLVVFGMAVNNYVIQSHFIDLDCGFLKYNRPTSVIRGLYFQRCNARRVGESVKVQGSGYTENSDVVKPFATMQ